MNNDREIGFFVDAEGAYKGQMDVQYGLASGWIRVQQAPLDAAQVWDHTRQQWPLLPPSIESLLLRIDTAADDARRAVAGDPLRAVEYDRARLAAEQFAAADYQGEVPAMVAAWAINGRTPQQAADSILAEAAAYTNALELLRTVRLQAKEQIRTLMAAEQVEQAQQVATETIASIEAAVLGIGNNQS